VALGLNLPDSPGQDLSVGQWRDVINHNELMFLRHANLLTLSTCWLRQDELARLRTMQLKVAQQLYEQARGRPAQQATDLVPRYLPALPTNPHTGQPMTLVKE
jgi:hypothetical protein